MKPSQTLPGREGFLKKIASHAGEDYFMKASPFKGGL
jgi:hypothetical protein